MAQNTDVMNHCTTDLVAIDAIVLKNIYWQKSWKIPGTSWNIRGYSRSAFRTGFYIMELKAMLDAGPQNFNNPAHIFVTHSHMDHIANLPHTLINDELGSDTKNPCQIFGHRDAEKFIGRYIDAMFYANAMSESIHVSDYYKYTGLRGNDTFRIIMNKTNIEVQVFGCDHRIPTISYGFSEIKQKLKKEYIGLEGKEIGALKKQGIEITHEVKEKKLAYVCDTSIKVLSWHPEILEYKVVFIECTFFMPDELDNARKTKHIHWDHLKPYVIGYPDTTFMLFHFSQRYKDQDISDFFQKEIDKVL
jgi:ribonuclease Z